jgi:nucleoside-diphosphate kinase
MPSLPERTLVLLKPDCYARRLLGAVLSRFERKGLRLVGLRLLAVDRTLGEKLYAEHKGKDFYERLLAFIQSGPLVTTAWEGVEAIAVARALCGATFGTAAEPGTIRGDFALSQRNNLVHASGDRAAAERELTLFFRAGELLPPGSPDALVYDVSGPQPR